VKHPLAQERIVVENDEPPPLAPQPQIVPFPGQENGEYAENVQNYVSQTPVKQFRKQFYPEIDNHTWNDWKWQLANRIHTYPEIGKYIALSPEEAAVLQGGDGSEQGSQQLHLPFSVTPYYLSLVDPDNFEDPIRKTVVPTSRELISGAGEQQDPLGEHDDSPVPGIVHRYPDRVLFLVTSSCAAYCRYCTRSRFAGGHTGSMRFHWETGLDYIREHREIRDVIVSGGDPLTLTDDLIDYLLGRLFAVPHVEMVRLGTKVPAVLPQRITPQLVRMLRRYKPLYMSIHVTHPREITPAAAQACNRLADNGIVMGSQTVLLKGVNDSADTLKKLYHELLKIRVRPYYLYQCDPVLGTSHFRTTIDEGKEIMRQLRGYTSGYAVPQYIVDTPGGGGKVPVLPDYSAGRDAGNIYFKNYAGGIFAYPEIRGQE